MEYDSHSSIHFYAANAYYLKLVVDAGAMISKKSSSFQIDVSVLYFFYVCPSTEDESNTGSLFEGLLKTLTLGYRE